MADTMRYRLDKQDRERKLERARILLGIEKERWRADVLDAALTHLIESAENLEDIRHEYPATEIQAIANTSVYGLHYRTSIGPQ